MSPYVQAIEPTAEEATLAADIELIARHELEECIRDGKPPSQPRAWLDAKRKQLAAHKPSYLSRVAGGLRARAAGKSLTFWRETRGTHGMDWVYDPAGTDTAPDGYSIDVARAEYERRQKTAPSRMPS